MTASSASRSAAIETQFPPASTLILAYDRSRQLRYYLPDHRIELLFTEAVAVAASGYDPSHYWERRSTLTVPPGLTHIVLPDLDENTSEQPGPLHRLDLGDGVELLVAEVSTGDTVRYGYRYVAVEPAEAAPADRGRYRPSRRGVPCGRPGRFPSMSGGGRGRGPAYSAAGNSRMSGT